jgi:purine-binding chemotaxis protein CheW
MSDARQYCSFYLDQLLFGVESQRVQEVMREVELTEVPLASDEVRGLMNLRGQIVAALDLRRRLDLPPRPAEVAPMCVVVRTAEGALSLLVDQIGDVVEVEEDSFERPPETLRGAVRDVILGVNKLDRQLLHVLDTDKVCKAGLRNSNQSQQ